MLVVRDSSSSRAEGGLDGLGSLGAPVVIYFWPVSEMVSLATRSCELAGLTRRSSTQVCDDRKKDGLERPFEAS